MVVKFSVYYCYIPFHGHVETCPAMPSGHAQSILYVNTLMYFSIMSICTLRQRYVYRSHTIFQLLLD